jgi:nitroimidazol reductase NimA-like FMN-containing flavoprotein (pyridoxamine 5'-phosphate oxidase superfamily)
MLRSTVFDEFTADECRDQLARNRLGRVAVSMQALPVVVPVTYGLLDGAIVFCTIRGPRLDNALAGAVVAFEIDGYDARSRDGWSVLVQGLAEEVTDPALEAAAAALGLECWTSDGQPVRYVRIVPTVMSGRQIRHREAAAIT